MDRRKGIIEKGTALSVQELFLLIWNIYSPVTQTLTMYWYIV